MNRLILSRLQVQPLTQRGKQWAVKNVIQSRANSTESKPFGDAVVEEIANSNSKKLIRHLHPTSPLSAFNHRIALQLRNRSKPKMVLDNVLKIVAEIKQQNLRLDQTTYNAILSAYGRNKHTAAIAKTLAEMKENGISPSAASYNIALEAFANVGDVPSQILLKDEILETEKKLTTQSYYLLLKGMCSTDQLEFALDTLEEMKTTGVDINLACYAYVIGACLRLTDAHTAFDLLKKAEEAGLAVESQPRVYMDVMRVGVHNDVAHIVEYCWNKAVGTYSLRPDEGTLLGVLRVAAKTGNTQLATDSIRQLSTSGYPYKEHYFTPLMEAFIVKNDLKSAFNVLDIMRVSGIPPTMRATLPIRNALSGDVDAIDKAYYLLEEMRKENKAVDISAFNVVVAACADARDLERTVATYREADNLGVKANVDTYNCVLDACVQTRMKGMGNVVIDEMKKAGITPNLETYSKMIELSCTQRNYEDAFVYLEEMKSYDVAPPESCYTTVANKLLNERDPRFHTVIEEMETLGYNRTKSLTAKWSTRDSKAN